MDDDSLELSNMNRQVLPLILLKFILKKISNFGEIN